jgi:prepilin-type processing-associated H-X9-DG protein
MPIPFKCPHCEHRAAVNDQFAGRQAKCPQCKLDVTIPMGEHIPDDFVQPPGGGKYPPKTDPAKKRKYKIIGWSLLAFCLLSCGGGFARVILVARESARRIQCTSHIKQITIAMHNYHDVNKTLPPASSCDELGWSWRVRILPYMEQQAQYEQFNFDEPWDSEHNLTVAETMHPGLACASDKPDFKKINGHQIPVTNYVMISGPDTIGGDDGRGRGFGYVQDGMSNTIMIAEVSGENRPAWTEPVDITLDDLGRGINFGSGMTISSNHGGGANAGFCDGSIHFLPETMSPEDLQVFGNVRDGITIPLP